MINVDVNEFKIGIEGTEYTFRLDFRALKKFDKKYENAIILFNEFLSSQNIYDFIVKVLCCSCVEKEFTEEELETKLPWNFKYMKIVDAITVGLIEGILSDKKDGKGEKKAKN